MLNQVFSAEALPAEGIGSSEMSASIKKETWPIAEPGLLVPKAGLPDKSRDKLLAPCCFKKKNQLI